jgi:isocitrate lyase
VSKGRQLREKLAQKKFLFTPGITTPLHAMVVERAGFDYVYTGGYDVSLTLLGLPDVGLITETEMLTNARHIARSVSLPVIADTDTGYGNAINVMRTVRDFEAAGLAAIHIEDQVHPKRCGHAAGKVVVPFEEAVGKLRAALDARQDKDFMIIARTDAVAAMDGSLDEAIRRAKAFARIGCDVVWGEFPTADIEYARRFAQEVRAEFPDVPLLLDYSGNLEWDASKAKFDDFAEMGYRLIHVSLAGMRTMLQAMWDYVLDLKARGAQAESDFQKRLKGHPMETFHREGFANVRALEAKYLPPEEVRKKYDGAVGL